MPTRPGRGLRPLALTVGYTRNNSGYDFRIFESTRRERAAADGRRGRLAVGDVPRAATSWPIGRGSGLDEALLVRDWRAAGPAPLRHRRPRPQPIHRQVDVVAERSLDVQRVRRASARTTTTTAISGCRSRRSARSRLPPTTTKPNGLGAGAQLQLRALFRDSSVAVREPAAAGERSAARLDDRLHRDASTTSRFTRRRRVSDATPKRACSYDYSHAEGNYFYGVVPGGPLPPPSQLPERLQQAAATAPRCQASPVEARWRLTFSYLYEPFRVYDFAFDPTVVDSIVQPSSLVLGYVYRPYTAHSAVISLRYLPVELRALVRALEAFMNAVEDYTNPAHDRHRFVALMATSRPAAAQGDPKKGEQVYTAQKCSVCHSIAGKGGKANPLDGVGAKISADETRQWITNPKEMTTKANSTEEAADAGPV